MSSGDSWIDACLNSIHAIKTSQPVCSSNPKSGGNKNNAKTSQENQERKLNCAELLRTSMEDLYEGLQNADEESKPEMKARLIASQVLDMIRAFLAQPMYSTTHLDASHARKIKSVLKGMMQEIYVPQRRAAQPSHPEIALYICTVLASDKASVRSIRGVKPAMFQIVSNFAAMVYKTAAERHLKVDDFATNLSKKKNNTHAYQTYHVVEKMLDPVKESGTYAESVLDLAAAAIALFFRVTEGEEQPKVLFRYSNEDRKMKEVERISSEITKCTVTLSAFGKERLKTSMLFQDRYNVDKYLDDWKMEGTWIDLAINALLMNIFGTMTMEALLKHKINYVNLDAEVKNFNKIFKQHGQEEKHEDDEEKEEHEEDHEEDQDDEEEEADDDDDDVAYKNRSKKARSGA